MLQLMLIQGDVFQCLQTVHCEEVGWYNKKHLLVFPGKTSRDEAMFILSLLVFTLP